MVTGIEPGGEFIVRDSGLVVVYYEDWDFDFLVYANLPMAFF